MATWVGYPKWYQKGRVRPVQYIVIHTTEGAEAPSSAEDGHAYDLRRTDSVSTHLFVDSDTAVREVPDADRAYHARYHGNEIGIGVELCGTARQTALQWHDGASTGELAVAAREVAALCRAHNIPVRRLSVAQVRAAYYAPEGERPKGICGHVDVTAAYPEDQGSHYDPGPNFPWAEFLAMVQAELEDDDVPLTAADADLVATRLLGRLLGRSGPTVGVALQSGYALTEKIAESVDIDAAELDAIKAAAREGATSAHDDLIAAVVAALPPGASLTRGDVEDALRTVLRAGVGD